MGGQHEGAAGSRRRRYARSPSRGAHLSLTPVKLQLLRYLAECRFLSLPQLARLARPAERRDLSEKSARRHMRDLFDAGLVDVLAVSRAALAPPDAPNDASLLYGSAPNVYTPTRAGLDVLRRAGLVTGEDMRRPVYGPKNGLFLAHELAVRDVRVWLEECARAEGEGGEQRVLRWVVGPEAALVLPSGAPVLPDAWFVYQVTSGERPAVLVGLVEVDRGTERGDRRWGEKLVAYGALFEDREVLREATGYVNARVLVFCPNGRRRDALAALLARLAREYGLQPALLGRFWLADQLVLEEDVLTSPTWRQSYTDNLQGLLAEEL